MGRMEARGTEAVEVLDSDEDAPVGAVVSRGAWDGGRCSAWGGCRGLRAGWWRRGRQCGWVGRCRQPCGVGWGVTVEGVTVGAAGSRVGWLGWL